jgi:hypothetical protein
MRNLAYADLVRRLHAASWYLSGRLVHSGGVRQCVRAAAYHLGGPTWREHCAEGRTVTGALRALLAEMTNEEAVDGG